MRQQLAVLHSVSRHSRTSKPTMGTNLSINGKGPERAPESVTKRSKGLLSPMQLRNASTTAGIALRVAPADILVHCEAIWSPSNAPACLLSHAARR